MCRVSEELEELNKRMENINSFDELEHHVMNYVLK